MAVKIQRQGLEGLFKSDLVNLKLLAVILDKLDPKTDGNSHEMTIVDDDNDDEETMIANMQSCDLAVWGS